MRPSGGEREEWNRGTERGRDDGLCDPKVEENQKMANPWSLWGFQLLVWTLLRTLASP